MTDLTDPENLTDQNKLVDADAPPSRPERHEGRSEDIRPSRLIRTSLVLDASPSGRTTRVGGPSLQPALEELRREALQVRGEDREVVGDE